MAGPQVVPVRPNPANRSNNRNNEDGWGSWGRHIRSEQDRQNDVIEGIREDHNKVTRELSIKIAHLEARVSLLLLLLPISVTVAIAIAGIIFNWLSKK